MDTSETIHETSKFIDGVKFLPWYEYYLSVSLYNRLNNPAINAILKVYGICFIVNYDKKKNYSLLLYINALLLRGIMECIILFFL